MRAGSPVTSRVACPHKGTWELWRVCSTTHCDALLDDALDDLDFQDGKPNATIVA